LVSLLLFPSLSLLFGACRGGIWGKV
jgi:hypothetical protein